MGLLILLMLHLISGRLLARRFERIQDRTRTLTTRIVRYVGIRSIRIEPITGFALARDVGDDPVATGHPSD